MFFRISCHHLRLKEINYSQVTNQDHLKKSDLRTLRYTEIQRQQGVPKVKSLLSLSL